MSSTIKDYTGSVYVLKNRDGEVFYVGCTIVLVQTRLADHLSAAYHQREAKKYGDCVPCGKSQQIIDSRFRITCEIVEQHQYTNVTAYEAARLICAVEREYILQYLALGVKLTNVHVKTSVASRRIPPETVGTIYKTNGHRKTSITMCKTKPHPLTKSINA